MPTVSYGYTMLKNRRDAEGTGGGGLSPLTMPRLNQITNELGGVTTFAYFQSHPCPIAQSGFNNWLYDCYPAWTTFPSGGWALWNKWKVQTVTSTDSFSGNDSQTLTYSYSAPAKHYDDDPVTPSVQKTWSDFRGSMTVTVTDGNGAKTEHRFYRGMDGDNLSSGTTYIQLSDGTNLVDSNWLRGLEVETRRLTSGNSARARTVNTFTATLTAGSGNTGAYFIGLTK
ncbi:MAG: hypothetical protein KDE58_30560, partial [Caldilineaceae bacterium]|nr:hypothetical protein [Caldilineaceae bacterium]